MHLPLLFSLSLWVGLFFDHFMQSGHIRSQGFLFCYGSHLREQRITNQFAFRCAKCVHYWRKTDELNGVRRDMVGVPKSQEHHVVG